MQTELDEEFQFHMSMRERQNVEAGMGADEARYAAQRSFGNAASIRDDGRDAWGWTWLEDFIHDARVAVRGMLRAPGYTAVGAGTLAVAIGACCAVFTVAHAVLVRPLPFADADRLVSIFEERRASGFPKSDTSPANFRHLKEAAKSFSGMALFHGTGATLTGDGADPERLDGVRAGADFFDVLGVKPALGRFFRAGEDSPGEDDVVILSHELWQSRFGGDRSVIGRTVRLNEKPHLVIGVLPQGFQFVYPEARFWQPLAFSPESWARRDLRYLNVVARLKDGVRLEHAQAELDALAPQFSRVEPEVNREFRAVAVPLRQQLTGDTRDRVLLLVGAVLLVLLIGCANVAHLILSRSVRRGSELAVRMSLGASRGRIVRQLLTESLAISLAGGVAGIVLAVWMMRLLQFLIPQSMIAFAAVEPDWQTVAVALGISVAASLISGLLPALRIASMNWHRATRQGSSRLVGGFGHEHLRGLLVVSEVALAVVLVVGASLLMRTLLQVLNVEPGFRTEGVLTATTTPAPALHEFEARAAFVEGALKRVRSLPGVTNAAYMSAIPFTWKGGRLNFEIDRKQPEQNQGALNRQITPEYFRTLGIRITGGREFDDQDRLGRPLVAIVNEALSRRYFAGDSAIGRRLRVKGPGFTDEWMTIVGVCADVREMGLLQPAHPIIYVPQAQTRADFNVPFQLAVRTAGDPTGLAGAIRSEIASAYPGTTFSKVRLLSEVVEKEVGDRRPMTVLAGGLALIALVLSAVGVYGLLAFTVAQRIPEIGIRMALGAQSSDVLRSVIGRGARLAALGILAGLAGSFALTGLMRGLLFGVKPLDPLTFAVAPLLVLALALAASVLPGRAALRIDPAQALRSE
jgi:predicted permease